jgi:hypothetical protein
VVSRWGTSRTLPNISEEEVWQKRASGLISRMASSMRATPTPVNAAVSTGCDQEAATNEIAGRS